MSDREVISRFQSSVPVDVTGLAKALGIAVWEDDEMREGISGSLYKDEIDGGPSGFSIAVRASDPFTRKRFTVAHEIAHFVLHRNRVGAFVEDDAFYRSNLSTWEEVEANKMAADILMPKSKVAEYVESYGASPKALAPLFQVSEEAMRIRLGLSGL